MKTHLLKFIPVLIATILSYTNCLSAQRTYNFKHYNINSGLSHNTVLSLFQDSKGFIWIGTKNGLNRFDGCDFKIYHRNESYQGLSNSIINHIMEDEDKHLWLSTDNGISIYNPLTDQFSDFREKTENGEYISGTIYRTFTDNKKRIWIQSAKSIYIYLTEEKQLYSLNNLFTKYSPNFPSALYVEKDGSAYIALARYGIIYYNANTQETRLVCRYKNTPTVITGYNNNQLLMGTMSKGVWTINKQDGTIKKMDTDPNINSDIFVHHIQKVNDNEYWIASESGVYIHTNNSIRHLHREPFNNNTLSDNSIYTILNDKEGGIWIGSYFGGVDYIPKQHSFFETFYPVPNKNSLNGYRVREFACDSKGNLWIATEDQGLNCFHIQNKQFTSITPSTKPLKVSFTNIQCLNMNGDELWVGTFTRGIDVINLKNKQYRHYEKNNLPNALTTNEIVAIHTDRTGITWIGTASEVFIYSPLIDGFTVFNKIQEVSISDIEEDSEGNIWFTSYNKGVFRYNPKTESVTNFRYDNKNNQSLCYDRITGIFQDSKNRIWFSSEDGGFCRFNKEKENFSRVTTSQGLPSNVVYKILEDDNHYLWLSTNNGLVKFNPETMKVENLYNLGSGLQTKQFNYNSGIKTKDGTLYFGSINGMVAFNPVNFRPNNNKYQVVITDLYLSGQKVAVNPKQGILSQSMPYAKDIYLNYDQSTFGFSFSALNYPKEEADKYAYKLEGVDKTWAYTTNNKVSYNSIPPGNYTFRIKYAKNGYTWNDNETQVNVHIIPPFWQTTIAYIFYYLIGAILLGTIIYLYLHKKKRQTEEHLARQEQLKKEEIYQAKINFFTNIAHEIRTPITLIKTPLDYIIQTHPNEKEVQENLIIMEQNTDRLLELVNQLLDFRKIESKAFTLSLENTDICDLVQTIYNRFVPAARQRKLAIELTCPPTPITALVDKEAITKICSNLFNNAVKYASTYINITLTEGEGNQYFQLMVQNDGNPIPVDLRQNIFEAFFQIKDINLPAQPGSGIGLSLASSLAQLHHGKLFLDENSKDTAFVLQIPESIPLNEQSQTKQSLPEPSSQEKLNITSDMALKATILIVEDNDELRNLLAKQLEKYYQTQTAANGTEALNILKKDIINLIVSDVMMPVMDGLELCQNIKASSDTCHIPVILLTAKTTLENRICGLKHGADAYIEKPFSMPHLLAQINNLLENRAKLLRNFASKPYVPTESIAQNKSDELFLNRLTEIIKQNIEDDTFNIDNLASEMNMSRTSLHRKIKGLTELTPGDFIRTIRLRKAAELLLEGELRINEICMQIGIHSLSYFSKSFKEQFGVLPKDFVKKQKENAIEIKQVKNSSNKP